MNAVILGNFSLHHGTCRSYVGPVACSVLSVFSESKRVMNHGNYEMTLQYTWNGATDLIYNHFGEYIVQNTSCQNT